MQKTYKFRLYPNREQERKLLWVLEKCRFVYNQMLEGLNAQETPYNLALQSQLPHFKEKYPELKNVHSKVLQYEVHRLFSNLRSLLQLKKKGRKVGRLRFKGREWFKTFTYNQSGFKVIKTDKRLDRLHLSKIGDIPIRVHRKVEGSIKQITIKMYQSGKWYACIQVESNEQLKQGIERKSIQKVVGLDVGIKHFVTDSDGKCIENSHYLRGNLKILNRRQRKLSRNKKKSGNRNKQRIKVARLYEKITNQRDDFLHKLSRYYVDNYNLIVIENLNIKGMVRNHHLAQSISDVAWGRFARMLEYKAGSVNAQVLKVNPKGTSQIYKYGEKGEIDRDYNASLNILERGMKMVGQGLSEFTPVEIEPLRKLKSISASSIVESGSHILNTRGVRL